MSRATSLIVIILLAGAGLAPVAQAANDPLFGNQWALPQIGAPTAWSHARGDGIVIAVVDSGVDLAHEDLAAKLVGGQDFVSRGTPPQDEEGHGTHVAGIAGAITDNGRGVAGVAPGASIMPVRVLNQNGEGSGADVAAGIRWAVDNGAHVINLSLARVGRQLPLFGPGFGDAVEYAWERGVICVVAAGNDFLLWSGYANVSAIAVSAVDRRDRKPRYSSGVGDAKWGMAAPGGADPMGSAQEDRIVSTYWVRNQQNQYAYASGTSMSAPHVSGAAAVLRGMGLSPQRTVEILLSTAKDIGTRSDFGHGRLDMARAVDQARAELGSPAPQPQPQSQPTQPQTPTQAGQQPPASQPGGRAAPTRTPAQATEADDPHDDSDEEPETVRTETARDDPTSTPPVTALGDRDDAGRSTPVVLAAVALLLLAAAAWAFPRVRRRSP